MNASNHEQNAAKFFGNKADVIIIDDLAQPISKIKPTPQVGDILWVKHEVKYSQGAVVGLMRNPKPIRTEITAVYLDGSVRNNHSDVWECTPSSLNNWETINPDRVEK